MQSPSYFFPLAALLLFAAAPVHAQEFRADTSGFFPLWENTAETEQNGRINVGLTGIQVGISESTQIGIDPILFVYRTPNFEAKHQLWNDEKTAAAVQAGGYFLLRGASKSSFSPMYNTRLDNSDFNLLVAPISFSLTWRATPRVTVHQTGTVQGYVADQDIGSGFMPGYSAMVAYAAAERHSFLLHAGEVGLWDHDFFWLGASYRYQGPTWEFRLGQFYRLTPAGSQNAPAISFSAEI